MIPTFPFSTFLISPVFLAFGIPPARALHHVRPNPDEKVPRIFHPFSTLKALPGERHPTIPQRKRAATETGAALKKRIIRML